MPGVIVHEETYRGWTIEVFRLPGRMGNGEGCYVADARKTPHKVTTEPLSGAGARRRAVELVKSLVDQSEAKR